jgi:hypothetical protein
MSRARVPYAYPSNTHRITAPESVSFVADNIAELRRYNTKCEKLGMEVTKMKDNLLAEILCCCPPDIFKIMCKNALENFDEEVPQ